MLDQDPTVIFRSLVMNNWDSSATDLAQDPKFQTGWYDYGSEDPQISFTNTEENVIDAGETGITAGTGAGGAVQYRAGQLLVNCWAGTYDDMKGMGENGTDLSPKAVSYDMGKEVHRIIQENASGTTDDSGQMQLHSLSASDARRIVDDTRDQTVFRYEIVAQYTYNEKTL